MALYFLKNQNENTLPLLFSQGLLVAHNGSVQRFIAVPVDGIGNALTPNGNGIVRGENGCAQFSRRSRAIAVCDCQRVAESGVHRCYRRDGNSNFFCFAVCINIAVASERADNGVNDALGVISGGGRPCDGQGPRATGFGGD